MKPGIRVLVLGDCWERLTPCGAPVSRDEGDKPGRYSGSSHKANTKMDAAIPRPIQSSISSARSCRSSSMAQAPGIGGSTSGGHARTRASGRARIAATF